MIGTIKDDPLRLASRIGQLRYAIAHTDNMERIKSLSVELTDKQDRLGVIITLLQDVLSDDNKSG